MNTTHPSRALRLILTGSAATLLSLFSSAHAADAIFSSDAFTSDATSGVGTNKTYTAIANVIGGDVVVNGVTFAGSAGGTSGTNWALTGLGLQFGGGGNHTTNFGGQAIAGLFDAFQYNGNPGTVTLSGLTAGQTYVATFYNEAWNLGDNRTQTITSSEGASIVYNEDALEASVLRYTFVATGTSTTLNLLPFIPGNSMHIYGLSNEQVFNSTLTAGSSATTATWSGATPFGAGTSANFGAQGAPSTFTLDVPVTTGHVQFNGTNAWTVTGNALTLQADVGGVSVLSTPTGAHTIATPVTLASDAIKTGAGQLTLSGVVSGSKGLNVSSGTLRFGAVNNYTGATTVSKNAILDLNGTSQGLSALNGAGTVVNNGAAASALTVNAGNFAGAIADGTGTVALTKSSASTLTLRNASTYTGLTTVNNGTLRLEGSGSPLITDNFTTTGTPDNHSLNFNIANRQTGTVATQNWTGVGGEVQVGNGGTNVQQSSGTNADYLLVAFGGSATLADMPLSATNVPGPVKISFDMFKGTTGGDPTNWTSFTLRGAANQGFPVAGGGELGFLYRQNTGVQVFNNGGALATIDSTSGNDSFAFYLADAIGTGSPFGNNGASVVITQGGSILGRYALNSAMGTRYVTFGSNGGKISGVDNLAVTPQQTNILPSSTRLNLTAGSAAVQLENVQQTVAGLDGVAGTSVAMGPFSRLIVNGSTDSTFAGVISGAAAGITKTGNGKLTLSGANTYDGVTIFAGGTVNATTFADYGLPSSLGNRVADTGGENMGLLFRGGTLQYTGSTAQSTNRQIRINADGGGGNPGGATIDASGTTPAATLSFTAATSVNFFENPGSRTLTLTGTNTGLNTFAMGIGEAGARTTVVKNGPGTWLLTGANTYSGQTLINAGALRVASSTGLGAGGFNGTSNTLIANGAALELQGGITLDEHFHFAGAGPTGKGGLRSVSGDNILTTNFAIDSDSTIGVDANSLTVNAAIYHDNGSFGITKVGAGTLIFGGTNTYTGNTFVAAGTLQVNGSTVLSPTTVQTGGTLSGVNGNLGETSVQAGGTLAPGPSVALLNFNANLTLGGSASFDVNKSGLSLTSDLANVSGNLTLGGSLTVLATGDPLANGDTFNLFDASTFSGSFSSLNLPTLSGGLSWKTSNLAVDGTIAVVPEPGAGLALLGGFGLLACLRRARRR